MTTVNINLYEFNELEIQSQEEAISNHMDFLNSISFDDVDNDDEGDDFYIIDNTEDRKIVIDSILANNYLFYKDGSLASCTTYTGKHEKAGTTEFKLGGETYNITQVISKNKELETIIDKMRETIIKQVRETFTTEYPYIDMGNIGDELIIDFWKKPHILNITNFSSKCSYLCDYILANNLTNVIK